jgi:hypothetical protein
MLIALLAVLGVDLIVIVVLLASVLARRRWVKRQPGAFQGAIRLSGGEVDGLGSKWTRGYGRWVRDVLVWTKAPFYFRNEILATDGLGEPRPARPGEVKRLGEHPVVRPVRIGAATAELATRDDAAVPPGPHRESAGDAAVAGTSRSGAAAP